VDRADHADRSYRRDGPVAETQRQHFSVFIDAVSRQGKRSARSATSALEFSFLMHDARPSIETPSCHSERAQLAQSFRASATRTVIPSERSESRNPAVAVPVNGVGERREIPHAPTSWAPARLRPFARNDWVVIPSERSESRNRDRPGRVAPLSGGARFLDCAPSALRSE
jgi:hypothetical protein